MGKPLPMALRERVAAFVDEGHGHREASRHFRVSPRFVNELMSFGARPARWRRGVRVTPRAGASLRRMPALCASGWRRQAN